MWQLVKKNWNILSSAGVNFLSQGNTVNFWYDLILGYLFCLSFDDLLQNKISFQIMSIYTYLFANVQAFKNNEGSGK